MSDILLAVDRGDLAVLTLLDLSACSTWWTPQYCTSSRCVIRPRGISPSLVLVISQRPNPACPLGSGLYDDRPIRCPAGVSSRTDPVPPIHGWPLRWYDWWKVTACPRKAPGTRFIKKTMRVPTLKFSAVVKNNESFVRKKLIKFWEYNMTQVRVTRLQLVRFFCYFKWLFQCALPR